MTMVIPRTSGDFFVFSGCLGWNMRGRSGSQVFLNTKLGFNLIEKGFKHSGEVRASERTV